MNSSQIMIFLLLAIVVFLYIRKALLKKKFNNYNAGEVKTMLKQNSIILLDVRTDGERKQRKINGSLHIPLNLLASKISELEKFKEKEIVCYCQSGSRSLSACNILTKNGFKAGNLIGGISQWTL